MSPNIREMVTPKNYQKYVCEKCDFTCCKYQGFERHLTTLKHKKVVFGDGLVTPKNYLKQYSCEKCFKVYKSRNGLWSHLKKCEKILQNDTLQLSNLLDPTDTLSILTLVKQNQEFKEMMMEQNKYMMELAEKMNTNQVVNYNTQNNTQNNQFNLQFFLNETCKDAMNINQFIDSIQIKLEDLDYTGKHGYVKGLSNVIVRELKALDQKSRPLHCSDEKREVIYIKTNDVWEKDIDYAGVTRFTKHLAHKKFLKIKEWVEENPTCMAHDDKKNDEYLSILGQITSGFTHLNGSECQESMKKIIKALVKQITIQKTIL
jgi:hypothetical protein